MFLFSEGGGEHIPLIVQFINHYLGEPVHQFQMGYTRPIWVKFFELFHTTPEAVFGEYTVENAIPWYTVMFFIACILTVVVIKLLKGKLSADDPTAGQMTLEAGFLALRDLAVSVIGDHAWKYFPVVATFAVLVLISNLMGLFPMFMSPTASVNVTFALGNFVIYLLQLRRHSRERNYQSPGAFYRPETAVDNDPDHYAADFFSRAYQ